MNRKLIVLLIPLLLLPMVGFGYAAWRDNVTKQYKFHFGTVEVEIKKWHVDYVAAWDADSDGNLLGDEVNVTEVWMGTPLQLKGLRIVADPVGPGFTINITMLIHNKGRLPILAEAPLVNVTGLHATDPCWGPQAYVWPWPTWFNYLSYYYRHDQWATHGGKMDWNASHYNSRVAPTGHSYEPCESVKVTQKITLDVQPFPTLQCNWFRVDVTIPFKNDVPEVDQCLSGPAGTQWP